MAITNLLMGMLGGGGRNGSGGIRRNLTGSDGNEQTDVGGAFYEWLAQMYGLDQRQFSALDQRSQLQLRQAYAQRQGARDDLRFAEGQADKQRQKQRQWDMQENPDDWYTPDGYNTPIRKSRRQQAEEEADLQNQLMEKYRPRRTGQKLYGGW